MGSKNGNKGAAKATTSTNEQTENPESGTVAVEVGSGEPETRAPVDSRALFLAYDGADADLKALEASLDAKEQVRSDAVKAIATQLGNGPFDWNGKHLSVTTRVKKVPAADGSGDVEVTRYFFKGNKKAVQVI